jgi:hypothetical protein
MDSSSFFTPISNINLDLDPTKIYVGHLHLVIAKFWSPFIIEAVVPKNVITKLKVKPLFEKYFVATIATAKQKMEYEGLPEKQSYLFSSIKFSTLISEEEQLLQIKVYPKKIEYVEVRKFEICSIDI